MSNIAKRIAATVVLGLFTAGTPALAAETEVQIRKGEAGASVVGPGVVFRVDDPAEAAPAAAAPTATPFALNGGNWSAASYEVPKNNYPTGTATCDPGFYAISGICGGDPPDDNGSIRVVYSGVDTSDLRTWVCKVKNSSGSKKRTMIFGALCVD